VTSIIIQLLKNSQHINFEMDSAIIVFVRVNQTQKQHWILTVQNDAGSDDEHVTCYKEDDDYTITAADVPTTGDD